MNKDAGAGPCPTELQGSHFFWVFYETTPCSGNSQKALVACKDKGINWQGFKINRDMACRLCPVNDKKYFLLRVLGVSVVKYYFMVWIHLKRTLGTDIFTHGSNGRGIVITVKDG